MILASCLFGPALQMKILYPILTLFILVLFEKNKILLLPKLKNNAPMFLDSLQRWNQVRSNLLLRTTQATSRVILIAPALIADEKDMKSPSVFWSMGIQSGTKNNINGQLLQLRDRIQKAFVEEEEDVQVEFQDVVADELLILRPPSAMTR